MSNCVNIHNDIIISPEYLDIPRLLADMKANDHVNEPGFDRFFAPEATNEEFYFYWFLGSDNFFKDDEEEDMYILSLGNHRSGHTQRDLRGLALFLGNYLKTAEGDCLICPCEVTDEYDGFEEVIKQDFVIRRKS